MNELVPAKWENALGRLRDDINQTFGRWLSTARWRRDRREAEPRDDLARGAQGVAIEAQMADLDAAEKQVFLADMGLHEPGLNRLIRTGYDLLGLQTYFTAGVKEVRAVIEEAIPQPVEAPPAEEPVIQPQLVAVPEQTDVAEFEPEGMVSGKIEDPDDYQLPDPDEEERARREKIILDFSQQLGLGSPVESGAQLQPLANGIATLRQALKQGSFAGSQIT